MRSVWGPGIRRLFVLAARADPRRATLAAVFLVAGSLATGAAALGSKWVIDGATGGDWTLAMLGGAAAGAGFAVSSAGGRALGNLQLYLADKVAIALDAEVLTLTGAPPGIEHLERGDYLDRVTLARDSTRDLARSMWTITDGASMVVRLTVAVGLLASVYPPYVAFPLFALPSVLLVQRARKPVTIAELETAEEARMSRDLHSLFTDPERVKELRTFNAVDGADAKATQLWTRVTRRRLWAHVRSMGVSLIGWLTFGAGFGAVLAITAVRAVAGAATVGDLVLVWQLARDVRGNVGAAIGSWQGVVGIRVMLERFDWLAEYAASHPSGAEGDEPVPRGQRLEVEGVRFRYPGQDEDALVDITLSLEPGSILAVVGENGAGKSTLVKLIARLYAPSAGAIRWGQRDLADIDLAAWRSGVTAAFQDFVRYETTLRESVDPAGEGPELVRDALARASADDLEATLRDGLDTHLGKTYLPGAQLSVGQWQKVAIARALLREAPLILLLDEPTAAIDPESEHQLVERLRALAEGARRTDTVTIIVTHRLSMATAADRVAVLDGGRLVEHGTHDELLARGGVYHDLFSIQARAYS